MGKIKILNESLGKVKSLAGLKRYLKNGGRLKHMAQAYVSTFLGGEPENVLDREVIEVPVRVLSNSAELRDSKGHITKLDLGKEKDWSFLDRFATHTYTDVPNWGYDTTITSIYVMIDAPL